MERKATSSVVGNSPKRNIPAYLVPLLKLDVSLTRKLAVCAGNESTLAVLRPHMKALEWSCHGVPWFVGCLAAIFLFRSPWAQQVFLNLFFALVLDVVLVALLKSYFRRGRPAHNRNDMRATPGFVDIYAFPSGHASRSFMVTLLALGGRFGLAVNLTLGTMMIIWSVVVSASRVLLGRHHIGDVLVGVLLGYVEHAIVDKWLWLGPEAVGSFLWFLDADKTDDF